MIDFVFHQIVPAAYALLPPVMRSPQATALLLSIGLQESKFQYRRQIGNGPARGLFQFEVIGAAEVRRHPASRPHLTAALRALQYPHTLSAAKLHEAIEHNDVLAVICARLALWRLPQPLPERDAPDHGWDQYYDAWKPGAPRPADWLPNFERAWQLVSTT